MRLAHTVISLMLIAPLSWAGNMTFQFRNPNFGGNPNNGAFLLNEARLKTHIKTPVTKTISASKRLLHWITLLRLFSRKY